MRGRSGPPSTTSGGGSTILSANFRCLSRRRRRYSLGERARGAAETLLLGRPETEHLMTEDSRSTDGSSNLRQPRWLYKYLSPGGVKMLSSLTLRFTPPSDVNDPYEMRAPLNRDGQKSSCSAPNYQVGSTSRPGVLGDAICSRYGIACFSETAKTCSCGRTTPTPMQDSL